MCLERLRRTQAASTIIPSQTTYNTLIRKGRVNPNQKKWVAKLMRGPRPEEGDGCRLNKCWQPVDNAETGGTA
jgi:hypothetical protein